MCIFTYRVFPVQKFPILILSTFLAYMYMRMFKQNSCDLKNKISPPSMMGSDELSSFLSPSLPPSLSLLLPIVCHCHLHRQGPSSLRRLQRACQQAQILHPSDVCQPRSYLCHGSPLPSSSIRVACTDAAPPTRDTRQGDEV